MGLGRSLELPIDKLCGLIWITYGVFGTPRASG